VLLDQRAEPDEADFNCPRPNFLDSHAPVGPATYPVFGNGVRNLNNLGSSLNCETSQLPKQVEDFTCRSFRFLKFGILDGPYMCVLNLSCQSRFKLIHRQDVCLSFL
jgi:hypothetical protein